MSTYINIKNNTPNPILVRISNTDATTSVFTTINAGEIDQWSRTGWEVAEIIRNDTSIQVWAVEAGGSGYSVYPNGVIVEGSVCG